jgi:hypothetical protein
MQEAIEVAAKIQKYPICHMNVKTFCSLPRGKEIDLEHCPLGTWFMCTSYEALPDMKVVGQVVEGKEMLCDQWGSGLSVPERGINRYRLVMVD